MLDLYAFQRRDLQVALALCVIARDAGYTIDKLIAELTSSVDVPKTVSKMQGEHKSEREACPSCGVGQLGKVVNADGLDIVGCRVCRYSELRGD